ncbi:MAG: class I SAM-dependent methyltransferase [Candidatus Goldbacteria bacterium]|nr:class I SAM-dependent methyltransferase [Candidatus Goldiibacteriota bacterium]
MSDELYDKWKETQLNWDDSEFLEKKATPFMKIKWQRINKTVIHILEEEVIKKNEYLDLLDFGAGRGDFYKEIQGMVKKYTGIEPSEKMLKEEIIQDDFKLIHGNAEEFSEKESYDVCLLKEVLDHCYEPEKVIKNGFEALKDDGLLIVTLTNKNAYYKRMFKRWAKKIEKSHEDHLFNFSPAEVTDLMQKAGFSIEENISLNYLKLPVFLENFTGSFSSAVVNFFMEITDNFLKIFLKEKGGSFILTGRKNHIEMTNEDRY